MKKYIVFFFFLVISFHLSYAQNNKDFILTLNQDTLFGQIKYVQDNVPIIFKYQHKKISYHPSTIQSFGIFEKNQYHRFKSLKSVEGKAVFVKILVEGKINLYKYTEVHEFPNHDLNRYVYFIGASDQNLVTVSSSSYKRMVGQFFNTHSDFLKQLENCSFKEVPAIIAQYNQR